MSAWWRGAAIYQIYPRSFADSNGDGVGDLAGIAEKLDYVASLGVDGIWLSPFFTSPMKDFGYDVADYRGVDPLFGALADFDALVARAHALGLKVVIDQVYSHSSDLHSWFSESRKSRDNPRADWYVWADAKPDGTAPNNWLSVFGGPAWEWDPRRRQYYLHNFLVEQPDLNFHNPRVRDEILKVADFWLDRGVDGFRLDVVNYCTHDAGLRDNPPAGPFAAPPAETFAHQRHLYNCSRPENLNFVRALRAHVDARGDKMLLGEIFDDDSLARQIEYCGGGDLLHTAYSFHLLNAPSATAALFAAALDAWQAADGWPSWSIGNHDVVRFPTRFFGPSPDARAVRLALAILLCMRGTVFLYQGEELGLPQADVPPARLRDPLSIRRLDGAGRDGARTPMPWLAQAPNAGFCGGDVEPWLPVDPRHSPLAVDRQQTDPGSTLAFVRRFLRLRRERPALTKGGSRLVAADGPLLVFERFESENNKILCLFNLSETANVRFPAPPEARVLDSGLDGAVADGQVALGPWGGALLETAGAERAFPRS